MNDKTPAKQYADFVASTTENRATVLLDQVHMAAGIAGESVELIDVIKKTLTYNKPLDISNVCEELGDILFYVQGMLNVLGQRWTVEDLMFNNMTKLTKRYPTGYTDADAIERADKK